jgi:diketogulonate reductase-like aldo/keto reductase
MKLLLLLGALSEAWGVSALEEDTPQITLHGGQAFPLIGLGVGNLAHDLIETHVADSMDMGYRLIDTAHASKNEHLITLGVDEGLTTSPDVEIHVVTKVWYTYLGYERTKISVRESLEQLKSPHIRVHMLLHWPRCRDDIPWMKCEEEENNLPQEVKDAGPAPHLDKENAFKESWRALEDIFTGEVSLGEGLPKIESIGVSNFKLEDLKSLAEKSRITPHILQDNVWTYVHDPYLIDYCHENEIHYQAYNVMNGIINQEEFAPVAFESLHAVAKVLSMDTDDGEITPAQLVMKWLTQRSASSIPRTALRVHMADNSPPTIGSIPDLDEDEEQLVEQAIKALLRRQDLVRPKATFVNKHSETLHIFWWSDEKAEEIAVKEGLAPGESFETDTFNGHVFVAYDESKSQRREFTIQASFNQKEEFHIDEL